MISKRIILMLGLILSSTSLLAADKSGQYGALAIDKSNGYAFGWAATFTTIEDAVESAKAECAKRSQNCSIVLKFKGGCASYRTVDKIAGTSYGWGIAKTHAAADAQAQKECSSRNGGKICSLNVWACNANSKYTVLYEDHQKSKAKSDFPEQKVAKIFEQINSVIQKYGSNVRKNMNTNEGLTNYSFWSRLKYKNGGIFEAGDVSVYDHGKPASWNPGEPNNLRYFDPTYIQKLKPNDIFIRNMDFKSHLPKSNSDYSSSPTGRDIHYLFIARKNAYVGKKPDYIGSISLILYDDGAQKVKKLLEEAIAISH